MTTLVWDTVLVSAQHQAVEKIRRWISRGQNVSVIGLEGSGRDDALGTLFLELQKQDASPDDMQAEIGLLVDMQNLVDATPLRFYQLLIRTFAEQSRLLPLSLQGLVHQTNQQCMFSTDLFVLQSGLRNIVRLLGEARCRIVLIMDCFDRACGTYQADLMGSIRAVQHGLEWALSFVLGVSADIFSAAPSHISRLQYALNLEPLWLSGLSEAETLACLRERLNETAPSLDGLSELAEMTGGFPILIDAVVNWWVEGVDSAEIEIEPTSALQHPEVQSALFVLWDGLEFHERTLVYDLATNDSRCHATFVSSNRRALQSLINRGFVQYGVSNVALFSPLLKQWVQQMRHTVRGHVWFNDQDDTYYQGKSPLEKLSPRAEAALGFFLNHPYKKCEKDQLIAHVWETPYVTDDSVYQVIRELRRSLEPDSRRPCYLLNHRSLRGGRYQFFPEGRTKYRQRTS